MNLIDSLLFQGIRALREPRAAAADVIALGVPREAMGPALFLVVILSVILNSVTEMLAPNPLVRMTPFQMTILVTVLILVFAYTIFKAGQLLGGIGTFQDSLLLMIFLQALFLPAAATQVVLFLVSPGLAGLFIIAVMLFLTWLQINFIAALHGFSSLGPAIGAMLVAMIGTFAVMVLVAPFFVTLVGAPENV